jgi:hypothetical protein
MHKIDSVKDIAFKGMKVIYTGINGTSVDRAKFSKVENITMFDILTIYDVYNFENETLLHCLEMTEMHNADLFVEATAFFNKSFTCGQSVVYHGKTKFDSQKRAIEDIGVRRGDELVVSRVVANPSSVYLEFKGIMGLHNGLMFCDSSFWFRPN